MADPIMVPGPISSFPEPSSTICSICQQPYKKQIVHYKKDTTFWTGPVCSSVCEKSVLKWTGVVQGFAISSVVLMLIRNWKSAVSLPHGCSQDSKLTTRLEPEVIKCEPCHETGDCVTDVSQNSPSKMVCSDVKGSLTDHVSHTASYDSSTECESVDLDALFVDANICTQGLPQSQTELKSNSGVKMHKHKISPTEYEPEVQLKSDIGQEQQKSSDCIRNIRTKMVRNVNSEMSFSCCKGKRNQSEVKRSRTKSQTKGTSQMKSSFPSECGEVYPSHKSLQKHNTTHSSIADNACSATNERPFCKNCAKGFQSKWHLNYHMKRKHSGESGSECDVCGKLLNGAFDLSEHKRNTHKISYLCDICGRKFVSSNALKGHLATHSGVKTFFCKECGMGFVRKTSLANHQALHNKGAVFLCHVCSQAFKTQTRLNDHMMNLHHCGPYFDNRLRRLKAMGILVDRDAIIKLNSGQCTVCSQKMTNGRCSDHPDSAQQTFLCSLCGKRENDIVALYCHSKRHRGEADNTSSVSAMSFPSHGLLSYECKICFKKFKNKNYLIKHMQQHKDKRFACDICGKSFTYKCNLKSHISTHSQSRPFECGVCHKAFKLKYTLDVHQKHHCRLVGSFKCGICGKGLIRRESLVKHYRSVHPESSVNLPVEVNKS